MLAPFAGVFAAQGSQYATPAYTGLLPPTTLVSMSVVGRPIENSLPDPLLMPA